MEQLPGSEARLAGSNPALFTKKFKPTVMSTYIIGKVSNRTFAADHKKFQDAENQLKAQGHEVVNIFIDTTNKYDSVQNPSAHRIALLLDCKAVFVLPDFGEDPTCILELATANELNMKVIAANDTIIPQRITVHLKN